ncbi:MAG: efflux RND transporter periplasmic adaptor subunit [Hyphomicrobiales bacterium]|nr:efflux RND transporter periplasmic adaptor subunit [Hyphomicrobiales bacterium]
MRQSISPRLAAAMLAVFLLGGTNLTVTPGAANEAEAALRSEIAENPTIQVVPVRQTQFDENILVTGSLAPREEILVSPQIEGLRVEEILIEEGDMVEAGQVLAKLSDGAVKAQLAELDAAMARADAGIAQARSQIVQAEAGKKQADAAFERARDLLQSRVSSQATYDEREAAARNAAASLALAKDGLLVAEAQKQEAEARLSEAKLRLSYTEIKAPKGGLVSRRNAKLGALATATADPMFRIIADAEIELEAEVPEIYLPRVKKGQKAEIQVARLAPVTGEVRLISPEIDRSTRLGRVRIFIGKDEDLRIGGFARATIQTSRKEGLGVPTSSILNREGNETVLIVKDGRVETRKITVGIRNGSKAEIVSGLNDGELVVLRSGSLLRNGDEVRPVLANEKAVSEAL